MSSNHHFNDVGYTWTARDISGNGNCRVSPDPECTFSERETTILSVHSLNLTKLASAKTVAIISLHIKKEASGSNAVILASLENGTKVNVVKQNKNWVAEYVMCGSIVFVYQLMSGSRRVACRGATAWGTAPRAWRTRTWRAQALRSSPRPRRPGLPCGTRLEQYHTKLNY